ncbi:MAG: hypothetical protein E2600_13205 [Chryseobacterium sp.]|nr:hypothetical protein [Chryseobacterium sp.]
MSELPDAMNFYFVVNNNIFAMNLLEVNRDMSEQEVNYPIYSPTSVIGIFSNALKLNATVNLIYLKGRYSYGGGRSALFQNAS